MIQAEPPNLRDSKACSECLNSVFDSRCMEPSELWCNRFLQTVREWQVCDEFDPEVHGD